jgi:DNA-binding IclR family transcriptional regulator
MVRKPPSATAKPRKAAATSEETKLALPDGDSAAADRYIVPAIRRGLAMLRLFKAERPHIRLPEMVKELGVSRATAFRIAYTLEADGYLQRVPHSSAFQLGINVLSLGFEYLGSLDLIEAARPALEDLRDHTEASSHLGVREGLEVVFLLRAPSRHRLRSNVNVGTRMPLHATTAGRAMLFDTSLAELRAMYKGVVMQRFTPQTPVNVDDLYKMIERDKKKGYVSSPSAYTPGIANVAAPVRDARGVIVAAVVVSDYESLPSLQDKDGVLKDRILAAAMTISMTIGYRGNKTSPLRQEPQE